MFEQWRKWYDAHPEKQSEYGNRLYNITCETDDYLETLEFALEQYHDDAEGGWGHSLVDYIEYVADACRALKRYDEFTRQ